MRKGQFEIRQAEGPRSQVRCKACGATRTGFEPEVTSWANFHSHRSTDRRQNIGRKAMR